MQKLLRILRAGIADIINAEEVWAIEFVQELHACTVINRAIGGERFRRVAIVIEH